jgi:hypothetical protein
VTQDRLIIDGYARWELAKKRGMATILCLVYQRTEDEALRDFLWRHRRFDGSNDFTLIELSRDLKLFSAEKARLHQRAGGRRKGSAKLEASERVDSRKERARILGPWYLARAKALSVALSNAYFKSLGLPTLQH